MLATISIVTISLSNVVLSQRKWAYDEQGNNASHWHEYYAECGYDRQSPIDLPIDVDTTNQCTDPLEIQWTSEQSHYVIRNTGKSLLAMPFTIDHSGGVDISSLEILHHTNDTNIRLTNSFYTTYESGVNKEYCFDSLHFHWGKTNAVGSEHTVNGESFPLEVHLVHYSCDYVQASDAITDYATGEAAANYDDENVLAVIGVIFEIGDPNPVLTKMLDDLILEGVYEKTSANNPVLLELIYTEFDVADLLPESREIVAYLGSLTTPPCFETVRWHVLKERMTVSEEQMEKFRMLLASDDVNDTQAPNFRPPLPLNGRTIYQCEEDVDADALYADAAAKDEAIYPKEPTSYPKKWAYDQPGNNASHWPEFYAECGYSRQSPIDLDLNTKTQCSESFEIEWTSEPSHFAIQNTGKSILAMPFTMDYSGGADISGLEVLHHTNDTNIRLTNSFYTHYESTVNKEYCFDSLHFHWGKTNADGSEHTVNGESFPLEVHLVHYSCDYKQAGDAIVDYATGQASLKYDDENVLAVIGVIFEIGAPNPVIGKMLDDIIIDGIYDRRSTSDYAQLLELYYTEFDLKGLLPESREVVGYLGSLTTPPCFETVRWHVLKERMTVSEDQMAQFRKLLKSEDPEDNQAPNFRPVMPLNDRTIYECQEHIQYDSLYTDATEKDETIAAQNAAEEADEDSDSDEGLGQIIMSEAELKWMMVSIAFIVLFSLTLLICISGIICLCKYKNELSVGTASLSKKRRMSHQQFEDEEHRQSSHQHNQRVAHRNPFHGH